MTIADVNNAIFKFLEKQGLLKIKTDKKTLDFTSNKELQNIFGVKTSSTIDFSNNTLALNWLLQKVGIIKDVVINSTIISGDFYFALMIGGVQDEYSGETKNYTFQCSRTKPVNKINSAMFEVLGTFCGWVMNNKNFRSDIYYELQRVTQPENAENLPPNTQVVVPVEIYTKCPHCKKEMTIVFNDLKPLPIKDLD